MVEGIMKKALMIMIAVTACAISGATLTKQSAPFSFPANAVGATKMSQPLRLADVRVAISKKGAVAGWSFAQCGGNAAIRVFAASGALFAAIPIRGSEGTVAVPIAARGIYLFEFSNGVEKISRKVMAY
jgi:hypothetical protein